MNKEELASIIEKYEPEIVDKQETTEKVEAKSPSAKGDSFVDLVYKHFDLENQALVHDNQHKKVQAVYEFLEGLYGAENVPNKLNSLETALGEPSTGQTRLDHVYVYVKLNNQKVDIESKLSEYGSADKDSVSGRQEQDTSGDTAGGDSGGDEDGDTRGSDGGSN